MKTIKESKFSGFVLAILFVTTIVTLFSFLFSSRSFGGRTSLPTNRHLVSRCASVHYAFRNQSIQRSRWERNESKHQLLPIQIRKPLPRRDTRSLQILHVRLQANAIVSSLEILGLSDENFIRFKSFTENDHQLRSAWNTDGWQPQTSWSRSENERFSSLTRSSATQKNTIHTKLPRLKNESRRLPT